MNDGYQPKINSDALLMGYLGADPKKAGLLQGYTQQQVDRSTQAVRGGSSTAGNRPNPYIK